ncbi:PAS domain S-box-containing protein, partial [Pontibacter ummariensis]
MAPEQKLRIFEKINKYSLDIICTLDRQGCFSYLSDACQGILGYSSEELTGKSYARYL